MNFKNNIPNKERLIFALDVPTVDDAKSLVKRLDDSVVFYKIGLELFMDRNYFNLVDWLMSHNKKVFVDLKFFDIAETVRRAISRLKNSGTTFVTVHPVNDDMLKAVVDEKDDLKILAVTVLTSLSQSDIQDLGFNCNIEDLVLSRSRRAIELGCDGVISSGLEIERLRKYLSDEFLIVVPGIRPVENRLTDDQKRTINVRQAFLNGADYIVVGRTIRDAINQKQMAENIQKEIASVFQDLK